MLGNPYALKNKCHNASHDTETLISKSTMTRNLEDSTIRIFNTRNYDDGDHMHLLKILALVTLIQLHIIQIKRSCLETDASKNIVLNHQMDPDLSQKNLVLVQIYGFHLMIILEFSILMIKWEVTVCLIIY